VGRSTPDSTAKLSKARLEQRRSIASCRQLDDVQQVGKMSDSSCYARYGARHVGCGGPLPNFIAD